MSSKVKAFIIYTDLSGSESRNGPFDLKDAIRVSEKMNNIDQSKGIYEVLLTEQQEAWRQGEISINTDLEIKVLVYVYKAELDEDYQKRIKEYELAAKLGTDEIIKKIINFKIWKF